jgi:regulation of enolase protein 1 (concanavalin A-like superfamily)
MEWRNEPPAWEAKADILDITVGGATDFWRRTHDGGLRDSGHFYYQAVTGDFVARVKVCGAYASLYDQAGLMVRLDEQVWLKCGIEYLNGVQQASVVVTHDWSDWSVVPLANPPAISLRVVRRNCTVEVYYGLGEQADTLIRQAYLAQAPVLQVGIMAAAPTGPGFAVSFEGLAIEPAAGN